MPKAILILLATAALTACAGTGAIDSADNPEATTASETQKPKMRCRREKSTSSRIGERVCTPIGD